jgi:nitrogen fixation NifU-like protein
MDHFQRPRHAGTLEDATAQVELTNPVCGDVLRLAVRVENKRVVAARFKVSGCVPAIACGSWLTEWLEGRSVDELGALTDTEIAEALGGLPPASRHAAQLAVDVLREVAKRL